MRQGWLGVSLSTLTFAIGAVLAPSAGASPHIGALQAQQSALLAPAYQGGWRQQIRVATPVRNARWDRAPRGAVRVYNRRFDPRWQWRSAPRHRVVYTYYRGDVWFLDPTTGWAYSVDRFGIVYTADPYRGTVYSLGPLTRWTADLLYFFDFYHFDRGYWYLDEYDYFVDQWEDRRRYDYYTYDTAYSTVWSWEPYFSSPAYYRHCNTFSTVWVTRVRNYNVYIERNPYYRRELINNIGLPAISAAPPAYVSPRAVATTAYWEARDLAAAGLQQPAARGRDLGLPAPVAAGTLVDARAQQVAVPGAGAPVPGFNAPFPDGSYGFGAQPGSGGRGIGDGKIDSAPAAAGDAPVMSVPEVVGANVAGQSENFQRGRDEWQVPSSEGTATTLPPAGSEPIRELPTQPDGLRNEPVYEKPQYPESVVEPRYEQPQEVPYEQPRNEPVYEQPRFEAQPEPQFEVRDEPRFEPREEPRFEREEPRFEREEPRFEAREEPRFEREEPRFEPREEPRFEREEPRFEPREEPRFEAREEPRYEAPEEPRFEREEPREEPQFDRNEPQHE